MSIVVRPATYIPFYEPRTRAEAAPLLHQCLPELFAQKPLHARPAAPHHALGPRGRTRGGAEARNSLLMKTLPKVATEMALCVLTYNLTRVLNIVGVPALLEAIKG